ncbi:winged helix-turn-helix transcriptional regulator [Microbacterium lushaniae]|nr:winged helix-turn-helix transcriptional regulator [Microbacterium lushaniae]KAA9156080.1 winged helix-turn-helix transcriptional regulator [Microbacterium lushaniae]
MSAPEAGSASQPQRLRQTPSWLITQSAIVANRLVGEALAAIDAKRYHYALLAALDQFGPTSQAELGRRCNIDRSDMVATVNELVEQGHVLRTQDPDDRRQNIIAMTRGGGRRLLELDQTLASVQDHLLDGLDDRARRALTRALQRLLDAQSVSG